MRYLTIFPAAENIHLIKDVGMVPYMLHRECGYDSTLACYENGVYPYLEKEVKGLNLVFMKKKFGNTTLDYFYFIFTNRKNFDVVNAFHFQLTQLFALYFFKLLNPLGKTYLKLDAGKAVLLKAQGRGIRNRLRMWLLKKVDLVSVETKELQQEISGKWGREIVYVPNGVFDAKKQKVNYTQKQNLIITVGRIGAPEKSTDVLMEAFALFAPDFPDWNLEMVGPVDENFQSFIAAFFDQHPALKNRIIFTGAVYNREKLFECYAAAKIFCLTSKWESFGISSLEAGSAGCYIITSDVSSARDITGDEIYGRIFPVGNVSRLVELLKETANNELLLQSNCEAVQQYVDTRFSWKGIVRAIDGFLKGGSR